ncbi:MAG TPA: hypothetical protein VFK03_02870 [Candidatus Saccharimonadales bacterium]|nr:hypothetical protein [Candidatus Saccharimonadales bacterium]
MAGRPNFRLDHRHGFRSELYFAPGMVAAAKRGNVDMRKTLCMRFKADAVAKWKAGEYKTEPPRFFAWEDISVKPIKPLPSGTIPQQYRPRKEVSMAPNDPRPDVGEGGCGCDCGGCDIDRHCHNRGQGCKK